MLSRLRSHLTYANVGVTVALILGASGFAVAAIPNDKGEIQACYKKSDGKLRVIDPAKKGKAGKCKSDEKALNWTQKGLTKVVVRIRTEPFAGTGAVAPNVPCAPGERATGGGLLSSSGGATDAMVGSHPITAAGSPPAEGDTPAGWRSVYQSDTAIAGRVITFYAICAKP
jgi:hypothetical protein